jgi:hypothetical protein
MICPKCADQDHKHCRNLWTKGKQEGTIVRRKVPTNTHCDCQHKPSWSYTDIKSGATEKIEGIDGDSS